MNEIKETETSKIEQAYRDIRGQEFTEMPDLWNRIEAGFEEEVRKEKAQKKIYMRRYFALAAAALLVAVIVVPVIMRTARSGKDKLESDNAVMESAEEFPDDVQADDSNALQTDAEDVSWEDSEEKTEEAAVYDTDMAEDAAESNAAASERESASAGMIANPADETYRQIAAVNLVFLEADGETEAFSYGADDENGLGQIQEIFLEYEILNWPAETENTGGETYRLTVTMESGESYTGLYSLDSEYNGRTFSNFTEELFRLNTSDLRR